MYRLSSYTKIHIFSSQTSLAIVCCSKWEKTFEKRRKFYTEESVYRKKDTNPETNTFLFYSESYSNKSCKFRDKEKCKTVVIKSSKIF